MTIFSRLIVETLTVNVFLVTVVILKLSVDDLLLLSWQSRDYRP